MGKLSLSEFKKLGLQNRHDIMSLRLECAKYGPEKPKRSKSNECGAPQFDIPRTLLECYLDHNLTINAICKILCVSKSTIYRRMRQYGLSKMEFSDISDDHLDRQINKEITQDIMLGGPRIMSQAPRIMSQAPRIMLKAPRIMLKAPRIMLKAPRIMLRVPRIMSQAPRIMLKVPRLMIKPLRTIDR